jgi:hypothetical protein
LRVDFYYDDNGEKRISITYWFWAILGIVIFNVVLALVNPTSYAAISYGINSFGIILALVIVLAQLANIVEFCSKVIISLVMKLVNIIPKV